ncbi:carboxypeptidase-like regulatory domain-containing protein [Rhodanobacter sp. DHB23]|uniref:carboxypeptidase-like regulatory domain-containing protein n=1 Tax=Rhodanobacter sp. DHB23 TaxID=2775923 RepID=UPI00177DF126|nr:carboxypeptidase-like regulatory domain-containing protein [Rhodanobacter sp. DHB23]MBD8874073.1 carboxypeptidase regulatory-like domain-containing protein [Rhodanobacter sp. DHB23]
MNNVFSIRSLSRGLVLAGVAVAFAVAGISTASAQATTGSVFGKAPAGYSIVVHSPVNGTGRTVTVDSAGRYSARSLQMGSYTVTLEQNGQAIAEHLNVPVTVGRGIEVDFDCSTIKCGAVADATAPAGT